MEEDDFNSSDAYECPLSSIFNIGNPTLDDLSNTTLPHQNYQQSNDPLPRSNDQGSFNMSNPTLANLSNNNVTPIAVPLQNYQQSNDPLPISNDQSLFNMNNPTLTHLSNNNVPFTMPQENYHGVQHSNDQSHFNMSNPTLDNLSDNNVDERSAMLLLNHLRVQRGNDPFYMRSNGPNNFNMSNFTLGESSNSNNNAVSPTAVPLQNHLGDQQGYDPVLRFNNPNSFNMINPTLGELSNINNNNFVPPTLVPQQNHHLGVQQGYDDIILRFNDPNIFNTSNLTLGESSSSNVLPTAQPHQNHHGVNNDLFQNSMVQDQYVHNNFSTGGGVGNMETGSTSQLQGDQNQPANQNLDSQNINQVNPLLYCPVTPVPLLCNSCQVLREIVHTNGTTFDKLQIHGRLGIITHAIHHQNITADPSNNDVYYEMIDFNHRSINEIKVYIKRYCEERNSAGYISLEDPMSAYYDNLGTGLDGNEDLNEQDDDVMNQNDSEEEAQDDELEQEADNGTTTSRPSLSIQRERAAKMAWRELSDYYHLPIDKVEKEVHLCASVLKKLCRRAGLRRWPYRKVKSLWRKILILRAAVPSQDPVTRARTQADIRVLEEEIVRCCGGFPPTNLPNDLSSFN